MITIIDQDSKTSFGIKDGEAVRNTVYEVQAHGFIN